MLDVARESKISYSVLSKAYKRKDRIYDEAGTVDAAQLIGIKLKGKKAVYKTRSTIFHQELTDKLLEDCKQRHKQRRVLSITFVQRSARAYCEEQKELGRIFTKRGR